MKIHFEIFNMSVNTKNIFKWPCVYGSMPKGYFWLMVDAKVEIMLLLLVAKVKFLCLDSISGLITWLFPWDAKWWERRKKVDDCFWKSPNTIHTLSENYVISIIRASPCMEAKSYNVAGLNHLLYSWKRTDFILNHFMYNNFSLGDNQNK